MQIVDRQCEVQIQVSAEKSGLEIPIWKPSAFRKLVLETLGVRGVSWENRVG